MNLSYTRLRSIGKTLVSALIVFCFGAQSTFVSLAEANLWAERRKAIQVQNPSQNKNKMYKAEWTWSYDWRSDW